MSNQLGCGALIFGLFWSGAFFLWQSDSGMVQNFIRQFDSRDYPSTTGLITLCEVIQDNNPHGRSTTYGVGIQYRYEVAGVQFLGNKFGYNNPPTSSSELKWAQSVVASHPIGSTIQVYYNPKKLGEAVLYPGIGGVDLVDALLLMPGYVISCALWIVAISWLRWIVFRPIAGGVKVWSKNQRVHARLPRFMPSLVAVGTIGLLTIVSLGLVETHPPLDKAIAVYCTVFGVGLLAYFCGWLVNHSGKYDLIIDEAARTISLPATYGRKERVTIAFRDVTAITVELIRAKNNLYAPTILARGNARKIVKWYNQKRAEAFATWMRERIGLREMRD
jgi:hypothetical protein